MQLSTCASRRNPGAAQKSESVLYPALRDPESRNKTITTEEHMEKNMENGIVGFKV